MEELHVIAPALTMQLLVPSARVCRGEQEPRWRVQTFFRLEGPYSRFTPGQGGRSHLAKEMPPPILGDDEVCRQDLLMLGGNPSPATQASICALPLPLSGSLPPRFCEHQLRFGRTSIQAGQIQKAGNKSHLLLKRRGNHDYLGPHLKLCRPQAKRQHFLLS